MELVLLAAGSGGDGLRRLGDHGLTRKARVENPRRSLAGLMVDSRGYGDRLLDLDGRVRPLLVPSQPSGLCLAAVLSAQSGPCADLLPTFSLIGTDLQPSVEFKRTEYSLNRKIKDHEKNNSHNLCNRNCINFRMAIDFEWNYAIR